MTRAINIDADRNEVTAMCTKQNVRIAEIETLSSGGTRVVLSKTEDADVIRCAFATKLKSDQ
jgi:hypothetical protein